jgi:predicted permease
MSVRMSLGAGRGQIVRQLLAENVLLAAAAGVAALAMSLAGLDAMWRAILQSGEVPPYWLAFTMDRRVFSFLLLVCLGACVLSGLAPAWVTSRTNLVELLTNVGRGSIGSRTGRRWTSAFVAGQLALTIVLMSGTGLMIRSLVAQVRAEAGIDISGLVTARLDAAGIRYAAPDQRRALYRQVEERFAAVPGVQMSFASDVPLGGAPERRIVTERQPELTENAPVVGQMTIGERYFETLGARLVRGRMFRHGDADSGRLTVVNQRLSEIYFPGADPIGQRIRPASPANAPPGEWLTIVGVAPNVRQRSVEGGDFDPLFYVSVDFNPVIATSLIARSTSGAESLVPVLRREMAAIDPDLPLFRIRTAEQSLADGRWAQRFTVSLFSIFAAIALVLATVGLYAVTAYAAAQRRKEIGLRMALGARARDIWWAVTSRAVRQLGTGLFLGVAGGVAVSRILPAQLSGASGSDPATFCAVSGLLVAVALIATSLPARSAVRLDPMAALRRE